MSDQLTKNECDRIYALLMREISSHTHEQPKGSRTEGIIDELQSAATKIRTLRDAGTGS